MQSQNRCTREIYACYHWSFPVALSTSGTHACEKYLVTIGLLSCCPGPTRPDFLAPHTSHAHVFSYAPPTHDNFIQPAFLLLPCSMIPDFPVTRLRHVTCSRTLSRTQVEKELYK